MYFKKYSRAARAYNATHPVIAGAAIWYLGPGFGGVSDQVEKLIAPRTR